MPKVAMLVIWLGIHLFMWIAEYVAQELGGFTPDCDTLLCGTGLSDLGDILATEPSFTPGFVVSLVGDIIGLFWGLFSVDYDLLQGDHGPIHAIIGFVIRIIGAMAASMFLLAMSSPLLQRFI